MILSCPTCHLRFDDAERNTRCPHARLLAPADLERKVAAIKLIGRRVRVKVDGPDSLPRLIMCVDWVGRITLYGREGEFDPGELEEVVEV